MGNSITRFFRRLTARPTLEGHKIYVGQYEDGEAEYEYVEQDGKSVFDGPISFRRKYDYIQKNDGLDTAKGQFSMGVKDGPWVITKDVRSHPTYGFKVEANFDKGRMVGKLTYMRVMIPQPGVHEIHSILCNVNEGLVKGDVEAVLSSALVTGRCDEQGRPDGEWKRTINKRVGQSVTTVQTDTEVWEHGVVKEAFTVFGNSEEKKPLRPYIVHTISRLLSINVMAMLNFVKEGTLGEDIALHYEQPSDDFDIDDEDDD